jgi:hypothetical protein
MRQLETPQRDPVGNQPHPVKADHQPETSLAWMSDWGRRTWQMYSGVSWEPGRSLVWTFPS